jgi:hypothetical protein
MQTLTEIENTPSQNTGYCLIPLTRGLFAIVDADDCERLAQYKWYASGKNGNFYAARIHNKKTIYMHNEIIEVPKSFLCDHINHDTLDNRRCNLRVCTRSQNAFNQLPCRKGKSSYKGVSWNRAAKKWQAEIRYHNERIHLGYFDYEQDAAITYDDMAIELFGPFACLNIQYRPEIAEWMRQCHLFEQEHERC